MSTDRFTRACARVVTGVLAADSAFHVYWATGATWPAADDRALSLAVMGFEVPFTTRILVPLAVVLALAATSVHIRHTRGRAGFVGGLTHLVTLGVAAAAAAQIPLRAAWALGFGADTGTVFYWLNLFVYLPLCAALSYDAYRVATDGMTGKALARTVIAVPAVLTLLLAVTAHGYRPSFGPPAPSGLDSHYAETDLARFHYLREGSGPPVVLLPGGTAWAFAWQPQLEALSADHTVYVVDLPGQGYTELRDADFAYDLPAMDTAIGAFLDAVGLRTTALAGHSWSGGWALSYAQNNPERVSRLVLLSSSGLDERDSFSWEMLKYPLVGELTVNLGYTREALVASVPDLFEHKERATPAVAEAMWAPLVVEENRRSVYLLERGLDWGRTEPRLPATAQPALILWGDADSVLPVEQAARFAALMPNDETHVLPGCGHAITLDCPGEVTGLMRTFLA
ncbi:alpha/beta fold hydrolase [Phytomonospora endophytica]|uniref:4,5:9,10-diseco-3-hydroxy-5,9, 17-trioxoandrosta-1(10),2-diene-4-oate hydrolase n=1 Tax=Phytomonospora endophytica TaxID=714109 RepID=A0A841FK91_9ACTN|nr:alpha/beta fold hydrolase [Phytomonospora endophytica]MBB6036285.1 4,5:9,10-diseco-3-hydroxy-5,9,17-trioxoandrosta-1(10),2-diene-4-oate hydrolase [Phytomonospora endophytica]GIG67192.1 hypothetical protein Pen01_34870 [Phytomonospora endophytica]